MKTIAMIFYKKNEIHDKTTAKREIGPQPAFYTFDICAKYAFCAKIYERRVILISLFILRIPPAALNPDTLFIKKAAVQKNEISGQPLKYWGVTA